MQIHILSLLINRSSCIIQKAASRTENAIRVQEDPFTGFKELKWALIAAEGRDDEIEEVVDW